MIDTSTIPSPVKIRNFSEAKLYCYKYAISCWCIDKKGEMQRIKLDSEHVDFSNFINIENGLFFESKKDLEHYYNNTFYSFAQALEMMEKDNSKIFYRNPTVFIKLEEFLHFYKNPACTLQDRCISQSVSDIDITSPWQLLGKEKTNKGRLYWDGIEDKVKLSTEDKEVVIIEFREDGNFEYRPLDKRVLKIIKQHYIYPIQHIDIFRIIQGVVKEEFLYKE